MERREFIAKSALSLIAASVGVGAASSVLGEVTDPLPVKMHPKSGSRPTLAFVLYPGMTPLDIVGPANALGGDEFHVEFVWRNLQPVATEQPFVQFRPTTTFSQLRHVDLLCITGTGNPYALLNEFEMLDWLHNVGSKAEWVTSVCTGSILLGAAGLLQGYNATTHWSMIDDLKSYGATPSNDRVVIDRNRMTGGGVTAGIDFGLTLRAKLLGEQSAEYAQLMMQYDPQPPFHSGTPQQAPAAIVKAAREMIVGMVAEETPDWQQRLSASAARMQQRYAKT